MGEFMRRELKKVGSFEMKGSVVGTSKGAQEGHQGGFSRARTSADGDEFTRLDF
jgi:hypothetical protein